MLKMPGKMFAFPIVAILLCSQSLWAQDELADSTPVVAEHDDRIKQLLDESGLKYQIDDDGDFRLLFEYEDGRSQVVFVNSVTETWQDTEIREIWAVGWAPGDGKTKVPSDVSSNLIRDNARLKLGAWQVQELGGREVAVFRATVSADASIEVVTDTLRLVGSSADEKEAELLKSDDL